MKYRTHGSDTLDAEVTNISKHGFWLFLDSRELFLPFEQFYTAYLCRLRQKRNELTVNIMYPIETLNAVKYCSFIYLQARLFKPDLS